MTLTLGPGHVFTTPGLVSIAKPLGLSITATGIPAYVPADAFSPTEYHGLGRVSVGNSLGYLPHIQIIGGHQLVLPLPDELTLLSCSMKPGMTVTVEEIVRPGVLNSALMPWDRSMVQWTRSGLNNPSGAVGTTQQWSYTVPVGKKLYLAHAEVQTQREAAASTPLWAQCWIRVDGVTLIQAADWANVVGSVQRDALQNGPMILPAGAVLEAWYQSNNTGGRHTYASYASGFTFDA